MHPFTAHPVANRASRTRYPRYRRAHGDCPVSLIDAATVGVRDRADMCPAVCLPPSTHGARHRAATAPESALAPRLLLCTPALACHTFAGDRPHVRCRSCLGRWRAGGFSSGLTFAQRALLSWSGPRTCPGVPGLSSGVAASAVCAVAGRAAARVVLRARGARRCRCGAGVATVRRSAVLARCLRPYVARRAAAAPARCAASCCQPCWILRGALGRV